MTIKRNSKNTNNKVRLGRVGRWKLPTLARSCGQANYPTWLILWRFKKPYQKISSKITTNKPNSGTNKKMVKSPTPQALNFAIPSFDKKDLSVIRNLKNCSNANKNA